MENYDEDEREKDLEYAIDTGIIPEEYRGNKKFVLEVLEADTMIHSDIDENLRNDKEVIFELAKTYLGLDMDTFEFNIGEQLKNDNKYMNTLSNLFSESKRLFNISISESKKEILSEYESLINNRINLLLSKKKGNEIDEYTLKSSAELIKFFQDCFVPSKIHGDFKNIRTELAKISGLMIKCGEIVYMDDEHKKKGEKLDESVEENKKLNEELQELQKQNQKDVGDK